MKRRIPDFGCPRIAREISATFGIEIDKDIVRRMLVKHYRPGPDGGGSPSWLTFIGHMKDNLWGIDGYQSLWTSTRNVSSDSGSMLAMSTASGSAGCSIKPPQGWNSRSTLAPIMTHNSNFIGGKATFRVLYIEEIKSVAYTPTLHPFVGRLIGTVRREYLDGVLYLSRSRIPIFSRHLFAKGVVVEA